MYIFIQHLQFMFVCVFVFYLSTHCDDNNVYVSTTMDVDIVVA